MICVICKHEWCWICKQEFPVHLSSCPNYGLYLEILAFQGIDSSLVMEGDETIHSNGWFMYSGSTGSLCLWLATSLFLLFLGVPCIIIFNVFITPVYMMAFLFSMCGIRRQNLNGHFWIITLLVLAFIILYVAIPVVFLVVTIPQLIFHLGKKFFEFKDLCR